MFFARAGGHSEGEESRSGAKQTRIIQPLPSSATAQIRCKAECECRKHENDLPGIHFCVGQYRRHDVPARKGNRRGRRRYLYPS